MPTVPVYDPNRVQTRAPASGQLKGVDERAFGGEIGQSLQRAGQVVGQLGDVAEKIADDQAEARTREIDVQYSSHIRTEMYGEAGLQNLQGRAYVDNAPTYLKRIEDKGKELQALAKTPFEKQMVSRVVQQRLDAARSQIDGQLVRESAFANKAATAARASNAVTDVAMSYGDPRAYAQQRAVLDAALEDQAIAAGTTDPAVLTAIKREAYGTVHVHAVQDMVNKGQIAAAQTWLDNAIIKGEIEPAVADRLQPLLEKAADENEVGALVRGETPPSVVSGTLTTATPDLVAAVVNQESRGNPTAVSPKGAQGVMQVMPATGPEAARMAGVAWQPERMQSRKPEDVEYQQKLGKAYLNSRLKARGGSVVLALADYNAGMGNVDKWIAKFGDPSKGQITPAAFAANIPFPETKDYIAKISARLGGTMGTPLPKDVRNAADVVEWAKQFADPQKRRLAESEGMQRVSVNRTAEAQRQSDAWDAAQPYVQQGTLVTAIPKTIWNSLSPQNQTSMIETQKKGVNRVTSPVALDTVYNVIENDPEKFKNMDLLKVASDFSSADFEQLRKMQHDARNGQGEWKKTPAQYATITRNMASVAPPRMMTPGGKDDRIAFQSVWWQAVQTKQAQQKDPLTDDEVNEIGTRLLAETVVGKGLFGSKTKPLYEIGPDDKGGVDDLKAIPPDEYAQVQRRLTETLGRPPTSREMLNTWRTAKAVGG